MLLYLALIDIYALRKHTFCIHMLQNGNNIRLPYLQNIRRKKRLALVLYMDLQKEMLRCCYGKSDQNQILRI